MSFVNKTVVQYSDGKCSNSWLTRQNIKQTHNSRKLITLDPDRRHLLNHVQRTGWDAKRKLEINRICYDDVLPRVVNRDRGRRDFFGLLDF